MGNGQNFAKLIEAIPVVADNGDRDARFPTPDQNQRVENIALGVIQKFTGAWGTDLAFAGIGALALVGDGTTDAASAIMALHNALPSQGGLIVLPGTTPSGANAVYRIASGLVFTKNVTLIGAGFAVNTGVGNRAPGCIVKDGAFTALTLQGPGSSVHNLQIDGAAANTGNGIEVNAGRVTLEDVSVTSQGGVGVNIGATSINCNAWRIRNLLCIGNTSHGLTISDPTNAAPNVNTGLLTGYDARLNGGDGLRIDNAFDNNFHGVVSQLNTGYGIHCVGAAAHRCTGQVFWSPYAESNSAGDIQLDAKTSYCFIWGSRTGSLTNDAVVDSGDDLTNLNFGHYGSELAGPFFRSQVQLVKAIINNTAISGQWAFTQDATRELAIQQVATSATTEEIVLRYVNGEEWRYGKVSELLTLATGATTTDTSANLLPANAIIESVMTRVTTDITTAVSFSVGDPTTAARFSASAGGLTTGSTRVGLDHWSGAVTTLAAGPSQAAAAKVRITTNANPGAGVIRITVTYRRLVAATS